MCEWVLNSWKWFLIVFYWTNFLWNLFCNRTQKFFISNIKFWTSIYWYTSTTFVQETTFDENIYNYNFFIHSINSIYMKLQLFGYQIHAAVASGNLKQICQLVSLVYFVVLRFERSCRYSDKNLWKRYWIYWWISGTELRRVFVLYSGQPDVSPEWGIARDWNDCQRQTQKWIVFILQNKSQHHTI